MQDILIPILSSVNVFTCAEKGQRFGEIFKTIKCSFYRCTYFHNLISIPFRNLHSFYLQTFQNAIL